MPKNPVLVSSVDRISLFLPRRGVHVAALRHAGGFEFVRKMRHQLMMLLMRRKMMRSLFKRIWVQWPKYKQAFFRMKFAKIWLKFNILIFAEGNFLMECLDLNNCTHACKCQVQGDGLSQKNYQKKVLLSYNELRK